MRWSTLGQIGGQAIRFGTLLVLWEILTREEYGLLETTLVLAGVFELLKTLGTSEFLIKERELNEGLLSTIFSVHVAAGLVLGLLAWLGADAIAALFKARTAASLYPMVGASFVFLSLGHVHEALLRRELEFVQISVVRLVGPLVLGVVAIPLALAGWQASSFVVGLVAEAVVSTALLWFFNPWRPRAAPSRAELHRAVHFSAFLSASELLRYLFAHTADRVIIGRHFGMEAMGTWGLCRRMLTFVAKPVIIIYHRVVLPALAKLQDDADGVRRRYLRATGAVSLLICPSMFLLACLADPMLRTIYRDKWVAAVPLIMLLAPAAMLETLASTVGVLYLLHSRTGVLFTWTAVSGTVIIGAYLIGAAWGSLQAIALATTIAIAALTVPAFVVPFRFSGHRLRDLLAHVAPSLLISVAMALAILATRVLLGDVRPVVAFLVPSAVGAAVVGVLTLRLRPPGTTDLIDAVPGTLGETLRARLDRSKS